MASSDPLTDLTVKVGGRVLKPYLPAVDTSLPTEIEKQFSASFDYELPLESDAGIRQRERVLAELGSICRKWITHVVKEQKLEGGGGQLYTSGSYRLGVHEEGADIDCILVAPSPCQRSDFFGNANLTEEELESGKRDPNSLAEIIRNHPDVTNFVAVETAAVPILTFDWCAINIDLLFARLPHTLTVPPDFDIDNDAVLDGADAATEKSLNGPRVTNLIAAFCNGTSDRYQAFLHTVRCVRVWAKARGLYSNKMGYWGGVNCNLAVALTVLLYPNSSPMTLLRKFFLVMDTWRWPQPMMLTEPHDAGFGLTVWKKENAHRQVAPMITPAYPAMNSTLSCSRQTLQVLTQEFSRGRKIIEEMWHRFQQDPSTELDWSKLFAKADFFTAYPRYISLCITGPTAHDAQVWAGFVESQLRKLVSEGLARRGAIRVQLWPKKFEVCVADPTAALLTRAQRENCVTYFIGFSVDPRRYRDELNMEIPLYHFKENSLGRFQPLVPGMDVLVCQFRVKELPLICFESCRAKKVEAMNKRRAERDADTVRQERRKAKQLELLREKLKAIEEKKKRKHEEMEDEVVKEEDGASDEDEGDETTNDADAVETDALQQALDAANMKTREEAQEDRDRLLAGDFYEGEGEEEESDHEGQYTGDGARMSFKTVATKEKKVDTKRHLPVTPDQEAFVKQLGGAIVSDEAAQIIGSNVLPPFREKREQVQKVTGTIKFLTPFDVVELDARGHVIDMGDEDFEPSKSWKGRKAGFEFKMGARGLGYYRSFKPVVVPSSLAY